MQVPTLEMEVPLVQAVTVTRDALRVDLSDGRTISVPLAWFPRLVYGSSAERKNWRLIGQGQGIHWEDLDEDVSVENLLAGRPSGESQKSFAAWLRQRGARPRRRAGRLAKRNHPRGR